MAAMRRVRTVTWVPGQLTVPLGPLHHDDVPVFGPCPEPDIVTVTMTVTVTPAGPGDRDRADRASDRRPP
jgi:hypothetical protein